MNVVMVVPTGIGCEIGGHAGDATPAARLLASACDTLIVHPNVVNASDINESTENMWYVEGSILDRFLEGQIALEEVYSNRILLIVNKPIMPETINSVNAAKNTFGGDLDVMELDTPLTLKGSFTADGRATGVMTGEEEALAQIRRERHHQPFDVLAVQTVIDIPKEVQERYLRVGGVNPYGGAEAVCSRFFSRELSVPCAHAPYESGMMKTFNEVVDPRMAAEVVSVSYIHCVLSGLHTAPRIANYHSMSKSTMRVDDIDLMVSPYGCWGRPHDACADWDIPIIFVKENKTIYSDQPIVPLGKHYFVENFMEAAGIITGMKAGVTRASVGRG